MKQCVKCGKWYLPEEVNARGYCKICVRDYDWKRRRHITPDEYARIFNLQGGRCAICGKSYKDEKQMLAVDHCHDTNEIRGLLCRNCNFAIGLFYEDINLLFKAMVYLKGGKMEEIAEIICKTLGLQADIIKELKEQIETLNKTVEQHTHELEYIRKTF